MKGKLIKIKDNYRLYAINHLSGPELFEGKLSIKNCQSIERGYDFDEYGEGVFYAGQFGHPSPEGFSDEQVGRLHGFIDGFQKALEILGDKKYSESDIINAHSVGRNYQRNGEMDCHITPYLKSLQQNEWDVEIETYIFSTMDDKSGFSERRPKLDADGCLILKRI